MKLTLEIRPHGTFYARTEGLELAEAKTLDAVTRCIAQAYEGGMSEERFATPEYWAGYPRSILNVIHADILPEG